MKLPFACLLSLGSAASAAKDPRRLQWREGEGQQALPRQTVERVEGIGSIQEYLEFAPAWDGKTMANIMIYG